MQFMKINLKYTWQTREINLRGLHLISNQCVIIHEEVKHQAINSRDEMTG